MFAKGLMAGVFCGLILLLIFAAAMLFIASLKTHPKTPPAHTNRQNIHIHIDHSLPVLLPECARNLSRALATHLDFQILGDVGERPVQGRVVAINDVLCEERERMANLAIIATLKSGTQYYARSHFHFFDDGSLPSTYSEQWEYIHNSHEWKTDWCEFIRLVYPKELMAQKCAPASE